MNISLNVEPTPKGRPRVCFKNGRAWTYTDAKTVKAENRIRELCQNIPKYKDGAPLAIDLVFVFLKPKSAKKRLWHTVKPDLDNLCKTVLDGMSDVFSDQQIVQLRCIKRYGDEACIDINIEEVSND